MSRVVYGDNVWELDAPAADTSAPAEATSTEEKRDDAETKEDVSDEDALRSLGKRLGLLGTDVEDTTSSGEADADTTDSAETTETPAAEGEDETKPEALTFATREDFHAEVNEYIKSVVGVPLDELAPLLADLGGFVNQQRLEQQQSQLQQVWGDAYEDNYAQVVERFAKLPPNVQADYDNVQGAQLIWALIQQEQGVTTSSIPTPPTFDRKGSGQARATAKYRFTQSEIEGMSRADYAKQVEAINEAYQTGLVDLNG